MPSETFVDLVAINWSRAVLQASHEASAYRPQLLAALSSGDAEVRSAAVAALYESDDAAAHDAILPLLEDPSPSVRDEVAEYLSEFAMANDIPRLIDCLDGSYDSFHITRALCRLTGWDGGLLTGDETEAVAAETVRRWREVARGGPGDVGSAG